MVCAVRADLCIGCGLCVTLGNPTAPQQREFGCPADYDAINMHAVRRSREGCRGRSDRAGSCLRVTRRQRVIEPRRDERRRVTQRVERHARFDSRVRSTYTRDRRSPGFRRRPARTGIRPGRPPTRRRCAMPNGSAASDVGERRAARVVEVQRDASDRHAAQHGVEHARHLAGMRDADRVADRDFERRRGRSAARAMSATRRAGTSPSYGHPNAVEKYPRTRMPAASARSHTCCVSRERLVDDLVDVLAAERLGRRREHRDLADAGCERALEACDVRHQRRVARSGRARDAGEHLPGVGHLRHPFRADERRHFDDGSPAALELVDKRDLVGRRDRDPLVLQTVSRPDFDDRDGARDVAQSAPRARVRLHQFAFATVDGLDDSVRGRADRQLHLHRFEHDERLALFHRLTRATRILTTVAGIGAVSRNVQRPD